MAHDMRVEALREEELGEWRRLVSESPDGSIYALPEYLECLCSAAGGRFTVLAARQGEELAGGVALYERPSRWGAYVAPRLLLYYNGVVLRRHATKYPSEQTGRYLRTLAALAPAIRRRGYPRVSLRCTSSVMDVRPFLADGWTASPAYTYLVDVRDLERAHSRVEQNLRRLVRRCETEGMLFREDDDFTSFFDLHRQTTQRKQLDLYLPEGSFRAFFEALRRAGLCRLQHARLADGRPTASQLVLIGPGGLCHVVTAATDPAFLKAGATAFLRWKGIEALASTGCRSVDLTDAALNPVTHFKSQLGGDLHPLHELEAPRSLAYRVGTAAASLARRTSHGVRRLLRGPGGQG